MSSPSKHKIKFVSNSNDQSAIHCGYKLGYHKQPNGLTLEAMIQLELMSDSVIIDERQHEIYDFVKTDIAKIIKIQGLNGEKFDTVYLVKEPELKYDIKEGEIIRFKHCEFGEILPDHSYIAFYTTKTGALNNSTQVPYNYQGAILHYYKNGRMKYKYYYVNGKKTHTFGYYNNEFNSLHYTWQFENDLGYSFPIVREYIYNEQENPIAQFIISDGKIMKKNFYNKINHIESIYCNS